MDQDDDNDEKGDEDQQDENEDERLRSYSKKSFFGKSSKDYKLFNARVSYKPRMSLFRDFKVQVEAGKSKLADPFGNYTKWQFQHKKIIDSFKSKLKVNLNMKNYTQIQSYDVNSVLKYKYLATSVQITSKLKKQNEFSNNLLFTLNWWEKFKIVYGLQLEKKKNKGFGYGGKIKFQYTRNINEFTFLPFLRQYNELISFNLIKKPTSKNQIEWQYKSNLITESGRKFYLQHKLNLDPFTSNFTQNPINHTYSFNAQDSIGMFTFNSSLNLQNFKIKSKEVRFFIEYDRKYRFGLQRKNQYYELMVELYKLNFKMLKSFHFYLGGKNLLGIFKGKLNLFKYYYNYDFTVKFKPNGGNFYKDFSFGLNMKWNI